MPAAPCSAGPRPAPALPTFVVGRGRPVVYLPGLSFSHELGHWFARAPERAVIAPLARHHRVHWLGRRRDVPVGFTIADFARDTANFLRGHVDGPVDVVGLSTGGFVGLQLALDYPELVQRLVVVGAGARLAEHGAASERRWMLHLEAADRAAAWRELGRDAGGAGRLGNLASALLGTVGPAVSDDDIADGIATARADLAFDVTDRLGGIAAPTLLVVGDRDGACDLALARRTRAGIPAAELMVLRGTGHLGSALHPAAARRIRGFLAAGAPSTARALPGEAR